MAELQRTREVRLLVWPYTFTDERKMGEETEERENDRIIETLRRSIWTFGQPLKQVNCWRSVWSNSRLPEHSGVQIPTQAQFLY